MFFFFVYPNDFVLELQNILQIKRVWHQKRMNDIGKQIAVEKILLEKIKINQKQQITEIM